MAKKSKTHAEPLDAFSTFVRPADADLKTTLNALVRGRSDEPGEKAAPNADQRDVEAPVRITALRTMSRNRVRSVFSWDEDPLALVIDTHVSEESLKTGTCLNANFQLIDYATNRVRKDIWSPVAPAKGQTFSIWQGDMLETTPARWGLGVGLYLFRAILEIEKPEYFSLSQSNLLLRVC